MKSEESAGAIGAAQRAQETSSSPPVGGVRGGCSCRVVEDECGCHEGGASHVEECGAEAAEGNGKCCHVGVEVQVEVVFEQSESSSHCGSVGHGFCKEDDLSFLYHPPDECAFHNFFKSGKEVVDGAVLCSIGVKEYVDCLAHSKRDAACCYAKHY